VRVGIDARALGTASGRRGVGVYIRGLLSGLAPQMGPDDELLVFGSVGDAIPDLPGARRVTLTRPRRGITLWDQLAWPLLLSRRGVTIFHSPFYAIPRLRPPGCRAVQTVHDLTPLKLPGAVSRHNARIFRMNFRLARAADRLIVPSEATLKDVVTLLSFPAGRIAVIPQAADITEADIVAADAALPETLSRFGLKRRYLLHTGGHDIVKNLPGLLAAFDALTREGRDLDLVIAGEHGPATAALIARAAVLGALPRVRLPGFVPRPDLIALYRGAAVVVYPSWAEGFGLPVVEAMACGAPVVTSRAGSLPEVGGDACLYADAADPDSIAKEVGRLLDGETLAADLSRRGRERARRFSWRETARRTLDLYREMAA